MRRDRIIFAWALGLAALAVTGPARADAVTAWTREADRLGEGLANWHTLAIMHRAMHDAANAAQPTYARWSAPAADEPTAGGASVEAAIDGAAAEVLARLHPAAREDIAAQLRAAADALPAGAPTQAGLALGRAIGAAAVAARADDGFDRKRAFVGSDVPGRWRPTPPDLATSDTSDARPFLFADRAEVAAVPPPALGGPIYRRDVDEVRRIGGLTGSEASLGQSQAAVFWAYQSSQRGFVLLAAGQLEARPRPGGLLEHARILSLLTAALADSAVLAWSEKERFMFWRPVTAIDQGGFGVVADPGWRPFIPTPPHPDYPSGHAADCYVGAGVLAGLLGPDLGAVDYVAQRVDATPRTLSIGMGQHAQPAEAGQRMRHFASLADAAQECSLSRIWAGAHFRSADDEAQRLAGIIVARALAALPPRPPAPR